MEGITPPCLCLLFNLELHDVNSNIINDLKFYKVNCAYKVFSRNSKSNLNTFIAILVAIQSNNFARIFHVFIQIADNRRIVVTRNIPKKLAFLR